MERESFTWSCISNGQNHRVLGQVEFWDMTTYQASISTSYEGGLQQWEQKVASSLGWYSTGDEDQLGLTLRPDRQWFLIHGSEHAAHTMKFSSSPAQDGFVYNTIRELLHSSWPMPWERATLAGQTLHGSVKQCTREPSCWSLHHALALFR